MADKRVDSHRSLTSAIKSPNRGAEAHHTPIVVDDIAFISDRLLAEARRRKADWERRQAEEQAQFESNLEAQRHAYLPPSDNDKRNTESNSPQEGKRGKVHSGSRNKMDDLGLRYPTHPHEFTTSLAAPRIETIPIAEDEAVQIDINAARYAIQQPSRSQRAARDRHWRQLQGREPIEAAKRMAAQLLAIVGDREGKANSFGEAEEGHEEVPKQESAEVAAESNEFRPTNENKEPSVSRAMHVRPTHAFLSNFGPLRRRVSPLPSATEATDGQYHNTFAPTMDTSTNVDTPHQQFETNATTKLMYQNSVLWEGQVVPSSLAAAMLYGGPMTRSERLLRVRPKLIKMGTRKNYYEDLKDTKPEADIAEEKNGSPLSDEEGPKSSGGKRPRNPFPNVAPRYLLERKAVATPTLASKPNTASKPRAKENSSRKLMGEANAQRQGRATLLAPIESQNLKASSSPTPETATISSVRVNPNTLRKGRQGSGALAPITESAAPPVKILTPKKSRPLPISSPKKRSSTPSPNASPNRTLENAIAVGVEGQGFTPAKVEQAQDDTVSQIPASEVTPSDSKDTIADRKLCESVKEVGAESNSEPPYVLQEDETQGNEYSDEGFESPESPNKQADKIPLDDADQYEGEDFEEASPSKANEEPSEAPKNDYEAEGFEEVPSPNKAREVASTGNKDAKKNLHGEDVGDDGYEDEYDDDGFDPPISRGKGGEDDYDEEEFASPDDIQNDIFGGTKGSDLSESEGYSSDDLVEDVPLSTRKATSVPQSSSQPQLATQHRNSSNNSERMQTIPNPPSLPSSATAHGVGNQHLPQPQARYESASASQIISEKRSSNESNEGCGEADLLASALKKSKEKKSKKKPTEDVFADDETSSSHQIPSGLPPNGRAARSSIGSYHTSSMHSSSTPVPSRSPIVNDMTGPLPSDLEALNKCRESLTTRSSLGIHNGRATNNSHGLNTSLSSRYEQGDNTPMVEGHEAAGRGIRQRRGQRGSMGSQQRGEGVETPSASGFTSLSEWFSAK